MQSQSAYIPLCYYTGFLELLREFDDIFEVKTFRDLKWGRDFNHEECYPSEWAKWNLTSSPRKITVVIQHDVDSRPERSWLAAREEEKLNIPSTFMIFNNRIGRKVYEKEGRMEYTGYFVDYDLLHKLTAKGWDVGYHTNAMDLALFDDDLAKRIFLRDVRELRESFDIRFFSPHGGLRSPTGRTNNCITPPDLEKLDLRWVHNRFAARFHGQWSDGGINSPKRDPGNRDLRLFVAGMEPGRRYRILTHPQYYDHEFDGNSGRIGEASWFRDVENLVNSGKSDEIWKDVRDNFSVMREKLRVKPFSLGKATARKFLGIVKRIKK
ncbi:MAG: hypothetical protein MI807_16780 [Verrucomicrobiales bacterium]|nr:hypothetical protein [Verrucomicrobiales bacterium]